ncbi:MAE_28990/MAE_18760 family HEPN-like nuclease [Tenacibaculum maritimum]|uniref:MAE_28990/MAE_18760 family HEPN-like nuclease n=1 Tax=Tenacibaculum maritimum TaxID=107401 RepID=UPI0012E57D4C|nr:MAE_28990/MAE_18760 family HEPN-like nuclease [Tenacibaculum maritimum]MCD9610367.1 hypothetical protein [Tenacibaculum maritimum]CAA0252203.1 conserved hypothetical protein [Tenacibaculum maritimum]
MNAIRDKFHQEINDLDKLIFFYDTETKLLDSFNTTTGTKEEVLVNELSQTLKSFKISKKQFNYNSIIISLYGSFERFIENCIITYVDKINSLVKAYNNLPDSITKNHFILSLTLLNKVEQPRYNGPLRKEDIIKNLHTCINTVDEYQLNKDAFSQHSANFRLQVIDEVFNQIGIKKISSKIIGTDSFSNFIRNYLGLGVNDQLNESECFQILNDLAEYRNYVAHGVTSEIIQNSILKEYLAFFKQYSSSIIEVLNDNLLYRELEEKGQELGEITDVFGNGKIICFKTNNIPIQKGDTIIGKNKNLIVKSLIKNIKLDGTTITSVDSKNNYEIGIEIDDIMKKTFKLYLL